MILRRTYDNKDRNEIKEMLIHCTKNVNFTDDRKIFVQTGSIAVWFKN